MCRFQARRRARSAATIISAGGAARRWLWRSTAIDPAAWRHRPLQPDHIGCATPQCHGHGIIAVVPTLSRPFCDRRRRRRAQIASLTGKPTAGSRLRTGRFPDNPDGDKLLPLARRQLLQLSKFFARSQRLHPSGRHRHPLELLRPSQMAIPAVRPLRPPDRCVLPQLSAQACGVFRNGNPIPIDFGLGYRRRNGFFASSV
jgi:hypothetical protein